MIADQAIFRWCRLRSIRLNFDTAKEAEIYCSTYLGENRLIENIEWLSHTIDNGETKIKILIADTKENKRYIENYSNMVDDCTENPDDYI